MDALWSWWNSLTQYWNSLTQGVREAIVVGIVTAVLGGIALAIFTGAWKLLGRLLLAGIRLIQRFLNWAMPLKLNQRQQFSVKRRRIDAAVPSCAELGQCIDVFVQVRLPNTPLLSIEDWPVKLKPPSVERDSETVRLEFPVDSRTGKAGAARLKIRVVAPHFSIEGSSEQLLDVPPKQPSKRLAFLLTPKKVGNCRINVEVYSIDYTYLGAILVETAVGEVEVNPTANVANLQLLVVVMEDEDLIRPPSPYPVEIKVINQPPPPPPEPAPVDAATPAPAVVSQIPRSPGVGFVVRRDEKGRDILESLKTGLAPERGQFVALCGAGGVGKTTLAAEAARALSEAFAHRVAWVSADGRTDFSLSTLLDEIAAQLGHTELRPLALDQKSEQVRALVTEAPTLVVLDNFETIRREEQTRCADWFGQCAKCSAIITSRIEPAHAQIINIKVMSSREAKDYLKKLKTQARNPQAFKKLDDDQIINAADRNPLVLQWVIKQIDRAGRPLDVLNELTRGEGDAARRVFDRSFDLLDDDGRAALLALSLFAPSASRAALAEVAGFGADVGRLNRAVGQLSEWWLAGATEGNERLFVEGLTRELSKTHLSANEHADEFRQRFVAYFLNHAEAHAQPTPEDYDALEAEKDNLLSATDAALAREDWESVMRLADSLAAPVGGMLSVRGYWDEMLRVGDLALKAAHSSQAEERIAVMAHNVAVMYQNLGELDEARRLYGESLEIKKKLGNQSGIAHTLGQLGKLAYAQGELIEARRLYDECLEISKKLGEQSSIGIALHQMAVLAQAQGEVNEARRLYDESLEIEKKLCDQNGIAITLHELGRLAQAQGELDEARRLYDESLEINRKLGDQSGIALTLGQLGNLAREQGNLNEARRLYGESLEIKKKLGDQSGIAITLYNLGLLAEGEGNKGEAARLYREALIIFEKLKSPYAEIARESLKRVEGGAS